MPRQEAYTCSGAHNKPQSFCSTPERIPELMCFSASLCSEHSCDQLYEDTTSFRDHTDIILHNGWKYFPRWEKKKKKNVVVFYGDISRCGVFLTSTMVGKWMLSLASDGNIYLFSCVASNRFFYHFGLA